MPSSRRRLLPGLAEHVEGLARTPEQIGEAHRAAGEALAAWIAEGYIPARPLGVIVVCTGNSRRSILGSTMGNLAAAYWGMPEVRFHSGGTDPTAFNTRTIAALRRIGVEVVPTGEEAPRGEPEVANPTYRVRWGVPGEPPMETVEFSKRYDDPSNPQSGFAALMVCDEADAGCPTVRGASLRLSLPFADPKRYDDTPEEAARYDERRDDLGRLMAWVMEQARRRLG
jgi:arsenate reductase